MAAATFDIKDQVGRNRKQTTRRVEWTKQLDFSTLGDGTGLAADESAEFFEFPAGFVHEDTVPILRTAEGVAATVDIGTEADPDGLLDGGDVNGSANARVAAAGTEALAGSYFHTATAVRVTVPTGGATVDDAVLDVTFTGYMSDTE